jgi:hypothetical protein
MTGIHQSIAGSSRVLQFPKIEGFSSLAQDGADAYSLPAPSGVAAGRLLIFGVVIASSGPVNLPLAPWTCTNLAEDFSGSTRMLTGYRSLTGTETGNLTGDITGSSVDCSSWAIILSSVTGSPEVVAATGVTSAAPDPSSITPSWGTASASLILPILGYSSSTSTSAVSAYPTNFILQNTNVGGALISVSLGICARRLIGSPVDPGAYTLSASVANFINHTIAVRSA